MLDIKLIRESPDLVRERVAARGGGDDSKVDELLALDEQRRKLLTEVEQLKAQRNRVSKEIGVLMGQKKLDEAEAKKKETRELGEQISKIEDILKDDTFEPLFERIKLQTPNLPHESVPIGKSAEDNVEVRAHGTKPNFTFKPKSHVELCESLK